MRRYASHLSTTYPQLFPTRRNPYARRTVHWPVLGAVVEEATRSPFLTFLRRDQAAAELSQIPYQTWWLDTGELCVGLALPGVPALPAGLVASSEQARAIPAHWIAEEHLPGARQDFLALRQVAARHDIAIAAGELLLVKASRLVLVQDAERGAFAEIHCLCGEEGCALTALPVIDVLTHAGVRAWLLAQREVRWQEMTRSIVSWGRLSF